MAGDLLTGPRPEIGSEDGKLSEDLLRFYKAYPQLDKLRQQALAHVSENSEADGDGIIVPVMIAVPDYKKGGFQPYREGHISLLLDDEGNLNGHYRLVAVDRHWSAKVFDTSELEEYEARFKAALDRERRGEQTSRDLINESVRDHELARAVANAALVEFPV